MLGHIPRAKKELCVVCSSCPDHAHLPFRWDSTVDGGFSDGRPWMRAHDLYRESNVEAQEKHGDSVLSFWKLLLRLCKEHKDLFIYGAFGLLDADNLKTSAWRKQYDEKAALVAMEFTAEQQPLRVADDPKLLLSSYPESVQDRLQPFEGRIDINY
jgi:oligo-1,6-glucosidase